MGSIKTFLGVLGIAAICGLNATAVQITYAEHGVGYWVKGSEFNGDKSLPVGVQNLVNIWNGTAPEGLFEDGKDSALFTKGGGSLPTTLPDVIAYGGRKESFTDGFTVDNIQGSFSYLSAKYGNQQVVFYVAGLKDVLELPSTMQVDSLLSPTTKTSLKGPSSGPSLSHVAWLTGTPLQPSPHPVPEGGMTAAMLALGLLPLAWMRSKTS